MQVRTAPFAPRTTGIESVTNTATAALGDGVGGRYIFRVVPAAAFVVGTADQQDVTLWITFSAEPGATAATPVAGTTGYPIPMLGREEFILSDGATFKAIADTTTVLLVWTRVGPQ